MNKKYIKKIAIGFILVAVLITLLFYFKRSPQTSLVSEVVNTKEEVQIGVKSLPEKNIRVSVDVLDKKYETKIKEGSTVFEAMKKIQDESKITNQFSFKYKENAGLGSFVTEINNIAGSPGKYWIYYVNDKKASVGVSTYVLKEGDIINWKQEGL